MYNQDSVYYVEKINVLGTIGKLDFLEDTMTLIDEESNLHEVDMRDVQELREIGRLADGTYIYEHDVLYSDERNTNYEIELVDDNTAILVKLNDSYEPTGHRGKPFEKERISSIDGLLMGNIYQIRKAQPKVDFNLAIFRKQTTDDVVYYYVGNDKSKGTVDLVKVIYIGSTILEEEEYERLTFTHREFLNLVSQGKLKKVNPQELANYVAGKTYGENYAKPSPLSSVEDSFGKCDCHLERGFCDGACMEDDFDDFDDFENDDFGDFDDLPVKADDEDLFRL